jgi:hypothetical protein
MFPEKKVASATVSAPFISHRFITETSSFCEDQLFLASFIATMFKNYRISKGLIRTENGGLRVLPLHPVGSGRSCRVAGSSATARADRTSRRTL